MRNPIGFSTGIMYETVDPVSAEIVYICRNLGCEAIEVNCHRYPEDIKKITNVKRGGFWAALNDAKFKHFSVHAPCNIHYVTEDASKALTAIFSYSICHKSPNYIVIHPDLVNNWRILGQYNNPLNFSIAIENMDYRKNSFRHPEKLKSFFNTYPKFGFVLDINHWVVNDLPINGINEIIAEFSDRLVGVHLSGVSDDNYHAPIHKTDQYWLVEQLHNLPPNIPIILEGVCANIDEMKAELQYVRRLLSDY